MKTVLAVLAAIVAVTALLYVATVPNAAPPPMTAAEREAIAQEVLQAAHAGFEAGAANDWEKMMASWSSDASAYFVGEPAMYLNRLVLLTDVDAIRTYWEPSADTRSGTNLMPTEEHVAVLSRDAAIHVYKGDWEVLDLEGNVSARGPITATTVVVKENGEWKQLHYHQSWDNAVQEESTGG